MTARRRVTNAPAAQPAPYPPSWVDRLEAWVDHLPGPAWLYYAGAAVVSVALHQLVQRTGGDYHPGREIIFHVWLTSHFAYLLGLMHYLDRATAAALEAFRPALDPGPGPEDSAHAQASRLAELRYRLTTMPHRGARWASLLGVVFGVGFP